MWMAGSGSKGGMRHGSTGGFGHKRSNSGYISMDMHDLHATILSNGCRPHQANYRYSGEAIDGSVW